MPSGTRLGESLIYEYGPNVRIERGFSLDFDENKRVFTNDDGTPRYQWYCYQRTGAVDWDEERKVGKHPLNGHETNSNEFWIRIGSGTEDEMDALALAHARKLEGA